MRGFISMGFDVLQTEQQRLRDWISMHLCSNYVPIEKGRVKELLELWCAVQDFGGALGKGDELIRGNKELHKRWIRVQAALMRLG